MGDGLRPWHRAHRDKENEKRCFEIDQREGGTTCGGFQTPTPTSTSANLGTVERREEVRGGLISIVAISPRRSVVGGTCSDENGRHTTIDDDDGG